RNSWMENVSRSKKEATMSKPLTRSLIVACLGVLLIRGHAGSQIAVIDVADIAQNTITAIESVLSVANQILELTHLDSITIQGGQYAADLANLAAIIQSAQGLSFDITSIQAQVATLFDLHGAPTNSTAYRLRMAQIRQVTYDSYLYAMRAQTLLRTTLSTINHLTSLVGAISNYIGNMQGNQSLAEFQGTLTE